MNVMTPAETIISECGPAEKTIIIAGDDPTIHVAFKKCLSNGGFWVEHAYDGKEALDKARSLLPDIILLDVSMPHMDGRDICKKLKSSPKTKSIKIIMLSGKDQQNDRLVGLEMGADEYINKPCTPYFLARTLRALFLRAEKED